MRLFGNCCAIAAILSLFAACGNGNQDDSALQLRDMTRAEAREDFDDIVRRIKSLYGPLEYKERRFGYNIDELAAAYRAELSSASTDLEYFGVFKRFLTRLEDGHVSLQFKENSTGVDRANLPFFIEPFDGVYLITSVKPEAKDLYGLQEGDELVSIDDVTPAASLEIIKRYEAIGRDLSEEHWAFRFVNRALYIRELAPRAREAVVVTRSESGELKTALIPWEMQKFLPSAEFAGSNSLKNGVNLTWHSAGEIKEAGLQAMGAVKPYFVTPQTQGQFGLVEVQANEHFKAKYRVDASIKTDIYAAKFRYNGKTILLVRNATYHHPSRQIIENYMKMYRAILDQEDDFTDVLIVDQGHNGGGSYCMDFATLFYKQEANNFVQLNNADRKWIFEYKSWAADFDAGSATQLLLLAEANKIERAYDAGLPLAEASGFGSPPRIQPDLQYSWKKPLLVVSDELSGSCADAFPMLIQRNGAAKIFGRNSMGLGGSVEEVTELPHSGAILRLTRGLFADYRRDGRYPDDGFIENIGVAPDYTVDRSAADYRAGHVGYMTELAQRAIQQIP